MIFTLDNYELRINHVINKYDYILFNNPNIIAFAKSYKIINGTWTKQPCLAFYVKEKLPLHSLHINTVIPKCFYGVETDIVDMNTIKHTSKKRIIKENFKKGPIAGGDVIGNIESDIKGTITCALSEYGTQEKIYILSCNHVLARSTGYFKGTGKIGDKIFAQHSPYNDNKDDDIQYVGLLYNIAPRYYYDSEKAAKTPSAKGTTMDSAICYVGKNNQDTQGKIIKAGLNDGKILSGVIDIGLDYVGSAKKVFAIGSMMGYDDGEIIGVNSKIVYEVFPNTYCLHTNGIIASTIFDSGDSGALGFIEKSGKYYGFGIFIGNTHYLSYFLPLSTTLKFFNLDLLYPLA